MSDQKDNRRKGLSLRMVIVIMFIAGVAMSGVLLSIAFRVTEQYDKTRRAENDFLACQNAAFTVQDDIDMLDERAQNFVVTGSDSEAALYFDEVQTKRSMETAVEELKGLAEEKTLQQLNTAIRLHSMMAAVQRRAMRLAVEARGLDPAEYPMLLESKLTEEERALPAEEKLSRGEWGNTWRVRVNPRNTEEGVCFDLVGCPLADYARAYGYLDLLPSLCATDYILPKLIHAKLIRTHTCATGSVSCDYWYVGDESDTAKAYANVEMK